MNTLQTQLNRYLEYCTYQKRLDSKTLKAYRIDLTQFVTFFSSEAVQTISPNHLEEYISSLHQSFKPKTAKRKIASLKAFFHYLEYKEIIEHNPFNKIQIKFREPAILPKTIPLYTVEALLSTMYKQYAEAPTEYRKKTCLRDITVIELLFSTGIRISELCSLKANDIDLCEKTILIYGKGSKERRLQICNNSVIRILSEYRSHYIDKITASVIEKIIVRTAP